MTTRTHTAWSTGPTATVLTWIARIRARMSGDAYDHEAGRIVDGAIAKADRLAAINQALVAENMDLRERLAQAERDE